VTTLRWPLLAEVMPECDFLSRHSRRVAAPPEAVWSAVERFDPSRDGSPLVQCLFRLRGLRVPRGSVRDVLDGYGFALLADRPGEEIVFGTMGRFWAIRERSNLERPASLDAFDAFERAGWAKGAISIRVEPFDDLTTNLVTMTSVQCMDERARRRFSLYWALINLPSGWIRRDMLRAIARIAERT
jgi:hypothetical protein